MSKSNKQTDVMNWIYNGLPNTDREVLVAFLTPDRENVGYTVTRRAIFKKDEWSVPDTWTVLAWADFPRLNKDSEGNALAHHWLDVEGLK